MQASKSFWVGQASEEVRAEESARVNLLPLPERLPPANPTALQADPSSLALRFGISVHVVRAVRHLPDRLGSLPIFSMRKPRYREVAHRARCCRPLLQTQVI